MMLALPPLTTGTMAVVQRVFIYAMSLILVDVFVARGPFRHVILKIFGSAMTPNSKEARRLCGQVAARAVGCVFLFMMFPPAFRVLRDPELAADPLYASNLNSINCIVLASGYFIYDVFICLMRYGENGPEFLLHGVLCSLAYGFPVLSGCLHRMGAAFLMWELSTPFLYLRWVLLKSGRGETRLMGFANAAFALTFFGCRVVYGPIMSYDFWQTTQKELAHPKGGIPVEVIYAYYVAMVTLNSLNYYWFSQIVRTALSNDGKKKLKAV